VELRLPRDEVVRAARWLDRSSRLRPSEQGTVDALGRFPRLLRLLVALGHAVRRMERDAEYDGALADEATVDARRQGTIRSTRRRSSAPMPRATRSAAGLATRPTRWTAASMPVHDVAPSGA
jgi:hypothetical protein